MEQPNLYVSKLPAERLNFFLIEHPEIRRTEKLRTSLPIICASACIAILAFSSRCGKEGRALSGLTVTVVAIGGWLLSKKKWADISEKVHGEYFFCKTAVEAYAKIENEPFRCKATNAFVRQHFEKQRTGVRVPFNAAELTSFFKFKFVEGVFTKERSALLAYYMAAVARCVEPLPSRVQSTVESRNALMRAVYLRGIVLDSSRSSLPFQTQKAKVEAALAKSADFKIQVNFIDNTRSTFPGLFMPPVGCVMPPSLELAQLFHEEMWVKP